MVSSVVHEALSSGGPKTRARRFLDAIAGGRRAHGAAILAVLNVTPDSFSDGGRYAEHDAAIARGRALAAAGATLIDVGAETTKPGAAPVAEAEQLRRALPVVEALAAECAVTIDTTNGAVALACLKAGAVAVNDVSGGVDVELARAAGEMGAGYILSHARRGQSTMADFGAWPEDAYRDVVAEVRRELVSARTRLVEAGVLAEAVVLDPGLGFTKSSLQSARLLAATSSLADDGPVLIGASRKSFLTLAIGAVPPAERLAASLTAALWARRHGASVVRVHDVAETVQAFAVERLLEDGGRHA
jgi:dihydropteroate synthase